jgi:hypothetical protein
MYKINDDLSIYVTRGDIVLMSVAAEFNGKPYTFQAGDLVRIKVYKKKKATDVVLEKDFPVATATQKVQIFLDKEDTKIGDVISKPVDYWYEVELNPLSEPQTIIGYDEDGAKVFKLFPEGADKEVEEYEPGEEELLARYMDDELDLGSKHPVENQAIARAIKQLEASHEVTHDAVAKLHVTPEMYGAIGDGEADDTEAFKKAFAAEKNILIKNGTYLISDTIDVESDTVVTINNAKILSKATENKKYIFNVEKKENIKLYGDNATLEMVKPETAQQACIAIFDSKNILVDGFKLAKAGGDGIILGGSTAREEQDIIISHCIIDDSRRNGISIVGGVNNIKIQNCVIKNTKGATPQLGIDIETWSPELVNRNIEIFNCRFENNATGAITVFEYTDGVKIHDNYCDNIVSVKVNDAYVSVPEAIPTNIEMYNNTFKGTVYIYRVSDGVFAVKGNVFDGSHITVDHSLALSTEESIKNSPAKTICNNVFNNCLTAIYIGNNANISVTDNIINNCTLFLNLFGLHDCVISGNIVNGYNVNGDNEYCVSINGVVKNLDINNNIIKQPSGKNSVAKLVRVGGGSVEKLKVHHNNFEKALFTKVITYDAPNNNIDYANATPTNKNYTEALVTPCEYLAGTIVTVKDDGVLTTKMCVKDGGTYSWRNLVVDFES